MCIVSFLCYYSQYDHWCCTSIVSFMVYSFFFIPHLPWSDTFYVWITKTTTAKKLCFLWNQNCTIIFCLPFVFSNMFSCCCAIFVPDHRWTWCVQKIHMGEINDCDSQTRSHSSWKTETYKKHSTEHNTNVANVIMQS